MKKTINIIASVLSIILGSIIGYCSFMFYIAISIVDSNESSTGTVEFFKIVFGIDILLCVFIVLLAIISIILSKKEIKWINVSLVALLALLFVSFLAAANINNQNTEFLITFLNILLLVPIILEIVSLVINKKAIEN